MEDIGPQRTPDDAFVARTVDIALAGIRAAGRPDERRLAARAEGAR